MAERLSADRQLADVVELAADVLVPECRKYRGKAGQTTAKLSCVRSNKASLNARPCCVS
jgi:hypothetical protein